jgi:hypothetical protein
MCGWNAPLNAEAQTAAIAASKRVICVEFKSTLAAGARRKDRGGLVDEHFCDTILRDAARDGVIAARSAERSDQDEFEFQHGQNFGLPRC